MTDARRECSLAAPRSRADVAKWMLDQLELPTFGERTPIITVTGAA